MRSETIKITGCGSELQGVGHLSDGRAVFVPGALPGETVIATITREANRFCEARLDSVIEASEQRIEPICPHYGACGGCSALHMRYEYSLELKRQRVYDALSRIGGVENPHVSAVIGATVPTHYRNKAEYPITASCGNVSAGCYAGRSNRVISVDACVLQKDESIRVLKWVQVNLAKYDFANHVRFLVTRINRKNETSVVFSVDAPIEKGLKQLADRLCEDISGIVSVHYCRLRSHPAHALDGTCAKLCGADVLHDTLMGMDFALSPQSFFQVNPAQTEVLYRCALDAAIGNNGSDKRILDIYCGAGTITLSAAQRAGYAVGVEIVPPAIENAKRNAEANRLSKKTRFLCGDAAFEIPRLIRSGEHFDAVILDPPRKGADESVLSAIAMTGAPIVYVSCNPSTLARDVKFLAAQGYRFEWAQPVDMFPWTEHVETVVLLCKK